MTKKERNAAYYQRNKGMIKERVARRNALPENRVKKNEAQRERRNGNEEHQARRKAEADGVRHEVIEAYGGECACCHNTFIPHLTLDHVEGGGRQERMKRDQRSIYREIRRGLREGVKDDRFQILCWNCNSAKHFFGECLCQAGS